ncbi:MAG: hypothetical protein LBT67_01115 [Holosporaceae bacterium]|jgi:hypothetical protein|nr:hypothetical protein [Holosporaceae bacterium]
MITATFLCLSAMLLPFNQVNAMPDSSGTIVAPIEFVNAPWYDAGLAEQEIRGNRIPDKHMVLRSMVYAAMSQVEFVKVIEEALAKGEYKFTPDEIVALYETLATYGSRANSGEQSNSAALARLFWKYANEMNLVAEGKLSRALEYAYDNNEDRTNDMIDFLEQHGVACEAADLLDRAVTIARYNSMLHEQKIHRHQSSTMLAQVFRKRYVDRSNLKADGELSKTLEYACDNDKNHTNNAIESTTQQDIANESSKRPL